MNGARTVQALPRVSWRGALCDAVGRPAVAAARRSLYARRRCPVPPPVPRPTAEDHTGRYHAVAGHVAVALEADVGA